LLDDILLDVCVWGVRQYSDQEQGGTNLYRLIAYRMAGGCCVHNHEMEDWGDDIKM
jgi:hypothetical protein